MPPDVTHSGYNFLSVIFLPEMHNLNLIGRKYQTNSNSGTSTNKSPVLFKNGKVMKDKG